MFTLSKSVIRNYTDSQYLVSAYSLVVQHVHLQYSLRHMSFAITFILSFLWLLWPRIYHYLFNIFVADR